MIVLRSADRFVTEQPGIVTRHCFSTGAHYDPGNVAFGALIACDEHTVAGGAGFAAHRHRGVLLLSRVTSGTLLHTCGPESRRVGPGEVQAQQCGDGIVHSEVNASACAPLRFVQLWVMSGSPASYEAGPPPSVHPSVRLDVLDDTGRALHTSGYVFVFVVTGMFEVDRIPLGAGDSARVVGGPARVAGAGQALVLSLSRPTVEG